MQVELSYIVDHLQKLTTNISGVMRTVDRPSAARFLLSLLANAPEIARTHTLVPADSGMSGRDVTFDLEGTKIVLDGNDFSHAREMYCRRVYLAHPKVALVPGSTVVDLGANIGLFSTLAASRNCRVLAVEAQAGFLMEARRRLERNRCESRVELTCGLIGHGVGVFARPEDVANGSHHSNEDRVPAITMTSFLESRGVKTIDFLKVDIEGSEFSLFRSYEPWMSRLHAVAMEVHGKFGDPEKLEAVLCDAGLKTELWDTQLRPLKGKLGDAPGYLFAWKAR